MPNVIPSATGGRGRRTLRWRWLALCAGTLLSGPTLDGISLDGISLGGTALAAPEPAASAAPDPTVPPDREVAALLRQTEHQILAGHTITPANDNALNTWRLVLERVTNPSPGALRALADFAAETRGHAAADQAAGKAVMASDLTVFADQAEELVRNRGATERSDAAPKPPADAPTLARREAPPRSDTDPMHAPIQVEVLPPPDASHAEAAGQAAPETPDRTVRPEVASRTAADRPVDAGTAAGQGAAEHAAAADTALAGQAAPQAGPEHATVADTMPTPPGTTPHGPATDTTSAPSAAPRVETEHATAADTLPTPREAIGQGTSGAAQGAATDHATAAQTMRLPQGATEAATAAAAMPAPQGLTTHAMATPTAVPASNAPPHDTSPVRAAEQPPAAPAPRVMAKAEPAARPSPADAAMADTFARRGDAMLAIKDISAARKFYEFAANAGNAHAAVALARTYDPAFTTELGIIGLEPDPKAASVWYRKAAELNGSAPASVDPAAQVPPNAVKREAVR